MLFCRVRLEGQPPTTLQIIGNVVERSLELLNLDTEEIVQTINFGSTYYGTDITKSFIIYNNGPDVANFVVILEEGGEGQEVVCIYLCRDKLRNYLNFPYGFKHKLASLACVCRKP